MRVIAERIVKVFPGVRALDEVTLHLEPGSVHALLGENGAGKSTLIKILTGVYQPTRGRILIGADAGELREETLANPTAAQRAGIAVVHQERNLVPEFSVAENIVLNHSSRRGFVDRRGQRAKSAEALARLEVELDLTRPVRELSVAQMQLVEIARALATESRILLLDEPTASLSGEETDHLYAVVRRLRDDGHCIVLVSHKLEEVFDVADTVTVLLDGRSIVEAAPLAGLNSNRLIDLMVGRAFTDVPLERRPSPPSANLALELDRVSTVPGADVSLQVHYGEIAALYGLVGAGRSELFRAILSGGTLTNGEVRVDGRAARIRSVGDGLRRLRIGYVTENRQEEGVFLQQPVNRNVAVTVWSRLAHNGFVRASSEDELFERYRGQLDIRTSSPRQLAGQLSGGNQQKVSLAKWLAASCRILVVDEPTVGIDVRTRAAFHALLANLADEGMAVVLISSDLREVVALANRIYVMNDHRITGRLENSHDYTAVSQAVMRLVHASPA
jgi:ribose transport system ATP-binding protein